MASVFLSYDREDSERARPIALALEKAGHSVFWDLHIRGGAQFSKVIEEALKTADAVVVLWSRQSIESAWVRDEAAAGRDTGRLVPVTIDGTQPPLGFRQFQTIDLSKWKGRRQSPALKTLIADVNATSGETLPHTKQTLVAAAEPPVFHVSWPVLATTILVIIAIVALVIWRPWAGRGPPTLLVRSAVASAPSEALARDLAVKLGSLESVQSASVRLIGAADASKAKVDLLLEVGPTAGENSAGANLILKTAGNGAILWSQDFGQGANLADFKQQIAFTAARVVGCAGEGFDPQQRRLNEDALKVYINSCAQMAELGTSDPEPLVASFRQVVKKAPRFAGAWKKLLVAEAGAVDSASYEGTVSEPAVQSLRADIEHARALDPEMAEITLAEIALLPQDDLTGRMDLVDRAKNANPDNPVVLHHRSVDVQSVGRMGESIDDARRALDLDPLSPDAHAAYFDALLYAGRLDPARQALEQVQRLWPDSSTARDLEFRFNLRDGDPRKALPRTQQLGLRGLEMMLEARIDPAKVDSYIAWLINRRDYHFGRLGVVIQSFGLFHREDELYRLLLSWPNPRDVGKMRELWFRPQLERFRGDPRFMQVMARTPLLKYWRTTGEWPDFCFAPDLPYDCKKEAARLGA